MTDVVCPNCGSDRRYLAHPKKMSSATITITRRDASIKDYNQRSWYYCAKCGFKYNPTLNAEPKRFLGV